MYTYLETSGGQSSNIYINAVPFFNTSGNYKSMAASDSCFAASVPNTCCFIVKALCKFKKNLSSINCLILLIIHTVMFLTVI